MSEYLEMGPIDGYLAPGQLIKGTKPQLLDVLTWHARILPGYTTHDGDTLTRVTLDLGWHLHAADQSIRLTSSIGPINAPEVTGEEKVAGILVRNWVDRWLREPGALWLRSRSIDKDSRGRTVGEVWCGDHELGAALLDAGLAKFCEPSGKRIPFTSDEVERIVARLTEPVA